MEYRINGGRRAHGPAREWAGGERYGFENDDYYAEYRGIVQRRRARATRSRSGSPAVSVEPARQQRPASRASTSPTRVAAGHRPRRARHRQRGLHRRQPRHTRRATGPKYLDEHVAALGPTASRRRVGRRRPGRAARPRRAHHYAAVVWYLGDNRLTQDPEDELIRLFGQDVPGPLGRRAPAVPDDGRPRLPQRGRQAGLRRRDGRLLRPARRRARWHLLRPRRSPRAGLRVTVDPFSDCLLLADDFTQYYLGVDSRTPLECRRASSARSGELAGAEAPFGGPATVDNPIDEVGALAPTSDVLARTSSRGSDRATGVADYVDPAGRSSPSRARSRLGAAHADDSYMRLGRTFDLTTSRPPSADVRGPALVRRRAGYDHVIVEAHTVGQENWTTLPDLNGGTTTTCRPSARRASCSTSTRTCRSYLTLGDPCLPTGTPGRGTRSPASSDGWIPVAFDLSAYAGQQVEIVVSYVTDPFTGGTGVMVDDTRLTRRRRAPRPRASRTGSARGPCSVPPRAAPATRRRSS